MGYVVVWVAVRADVGWQSIIRQRTVRKEALNTLAALISSPIACKTIAGAHITLLCALYATAYASGVSNSLSVAAAACPAVVTALH